VHYSLHYKLHALTLARGQNTILSTELGWNDPRVTLAAQRVPKVGSFRSSSGFARAQILSRAQRNLMLFNTFVHP
jgi:hypothetical protein